MACVVGDPVEESFIGLVSTSVLKLPVIFVAGNLPVTYPALITLLVTKAGEGRRAVAPVTKYS